jgi:hypothetical protein
MGFGATPYQIPFSITDVFRQVIFGLRHGDLVKK